MSIWRQHGVAGKVVEILEQLPDSNPKHQLGTPYLTAYQLAIELDRRHPEIREALGYEIGGLQTGRKTSFSQYLGQNLSRSIKYGLLPTVEGGFLSNQHLRDILFNAENRVIRSSLTNTRYTLSMFRLAPGSGRPTSGSS